VQGLDPDDDGEYYLTGIDWESVDAHLSQMKERSMDFLGNALK
jgi:hypothetical protein